MINLYYYNPKVVEHLYSQINKLPIIKEEISKSNNAKLSVGTKIANIFNGEIANTFDSSKTQHLEYSNEYKALKIIEHLQHYSLDICNYDMKHEEDKNIWIYKGKCRVIQQLELSEKTTNVQVNFLCNNKKYIGNTSIEYWISSSTLNQILCSRGFNCEVGFAIIYDKKNVKTIQILYIYKKVV